MLEFMDNGSDGRQVILVAIDFSETSLRALKVALGMAQTHPNAELHLIHVMPQARAPFGFLEGASDEASMMAAIEDASNRLDALCGDAEKPKVATISGHVRIGEAAREIVQLASDIGADLIVVGTHGRQGVERVLLGSVAEEVVRRAPSPVLTVKPKTLPPWALIEPPCVDCVRIQNETKGERLFCDAHSDPDFRDRSRVHRQFAKSSASKWLSFGMSS